MSCSLICVLMRSLALVAALVAKVLRNISYKILQFYNNLKLLYCEQEAYHL